MVCPVPSHSHVVQHAAEIREHACSRIKDALNSNKHVKEASVSKAAEEVEQQCFDRATKADSARYTTAKPADNVVHMCRAIMISAVMWFMLMDAHGWCM